MMVRGIKRRRGQARQIAVCMDDPRHEVPACNFTSSLSASAVSQIREQLPAHLRFKEWHLAYAPDVHGTSLRTFYRAQQGPNVLVVRDTGGAVFGGYAAESWRQADSSYGSTESFVFVVRGNTVVSAPSAAAHDVAALVLEMSGVANFKHA
eukprot:58256-Amphidinium_carterae.1